MQMEFFLSCCKHFLLPGMCVKNASLTLCYVQSSQQYRSLIHINVKQVSHYLTSRPQFFNIVFVLFTVS